MITPDERVRDGLRPRFLGFIAAVALVAAGCGGGGGDANDASGSDPRDDSKTSVTSPSGGEGSFVTMHFDVDGAVQLEASTEYGPLSYDAGITNISCSEFAKGGQSDGVAFWSLPALIGGDQVGGHDLLVTAGVWEYPGPGTFDQDDHLQAGADRMGLNIDKVSYSLPYDDPVAQLVVKPDGSGTWTFPRLVDVDDNAISGSVRWTCAD